MTPNIRLVITLAGPRTTSWTDINGNHSYTFSPYENYTGSDRGEHDEFDSFPVLGVVIGEYLSSQIHELGNSIARITGSSMGREDDPDGDKDSGQQLQSCVAKKLSGGN